MNNKRILLVILAVLAATTLACSFSFNLGNSTIEGNGDVEQETRSIDSFSKIELNGIGNVHVELGETASLEVSAEENLLEYIQTYTRGETLVIEIENNINIFPTESVDFYITAVELTSMSVSGLADVDLPALDTDSFAISISGAGDITMDELFAENLEVTVSGLGNFNINGGEVNSQEISISGGGSYNSSHLDSQESVIKISGMGSTTVMVQEYLNVDISGGGNVNYYGDPEVDSDISGIGDIDHLD